MRPGQRRHLIEQGDSGGAEGHRVAGGQLTHQVEIFGSDQPDHRIASGGGVVMHEHHRTAVTGHLDGSGDEPFTAQFLMTPPFQRRTFEPHPDPCLLYTSPSPRDS